MDYALRVAGVSLHGWAVFRWAKQIPAWLCSSQLQQKLRLTVQIGPSIGSLPCSIQEIRRQQPVAFHIQRPCKQPNLLHALAALLPAGRLRHLPSPLVCRHLDPATSQVYYMTLKEDGTSTAVPYPASHGQVRVRGNMGAREAPLA